MTNNRTSTSLSRSSEEEGHALGVAMNEFMNKDPPTYVRESVVGVLPRQPTLVYLQGANKKCQHSANEFREKCPNNRHEFSKTTQHNKKHHQHNKKQVP
jgi:hypothetical protein